MLAHWDESQYPGGPGGPRIPAFPGRPGGPGGPRDPVEPGGPVLDSPCGPNFRIEGLGGWFFLGVILIKEVTLLLSRLHRPGYVFGEKILALCCYMEVNRKKNGRKLEM